MRARVYAAGELVSNDSPKPPHPPNDDDASLEDLRQRLLVRNRVVEASFALGKAVSAEHEIEPLCDLVVEHLARVFQPEALALLFLDESTGVLHPKRATGPEVDRAECLAALARVADLALARRALLVEDCGEAAPRAPHGAVVAAPLVAERKVKGVVVLAWSLAAPPSSEDLHLLEVLAGVIAGAIDNAWLYGEIQKLNARLEEKVRARTLELAEANARLERTLKTLTRAQTELVAREKMASLGQLTAGIAHEINNPLAYAISNVAIARERLRSRALATRASEAIAAMEREDAADALVRTRALLDALAVDEALRDDVASVREELAALDDVAAARLGAEFLRFVRDRAAREGAGDDAIDGLLARAQDGLGRVKNIVLELRTFSRLDEAQLQDADLDAGIETTLAIVRHLAKERGVALEHHAGMRAPYRCFPAKLNQVVLNLVTNALQATDAGGRVTVTTHDDAGGVAVEVRDDGRGIPPELLPKIFDPFFTTKPIGQGVGLGLSISYRIVEEHGGRIDVESSRDEGTCFTVRLPPRSGAREES